MQVKILKNEASSNIPFISLGDDKGNNKQNNIKPFINKVSRKLWDYNYDTLLTSKTSISNNDNSFESLKLRNFRFKMNKGDLVNNYKENLNFIKSLSEISPEIARTVLVQYQIMIKKNLII